MTEEQKPAEVPFKPWHVHAHGHPTKPDIDDVFASYAEIPDLEGYKFKFIKCSSEPS